MWFTVLEWTANKAASKVVPVAIALESFKLMNQGIDAMDERTASKSKIPAGSSLKSNLDEACGIDARQISYGGDYYYYYLSDADAALRGLRHRSDATLYLLSTNVDVLNKDFFLLFNGRQPWQIKTSVIRAALHRRDKTCGSKESSAFFDKLIITWNAKARVDSQVNMRIPEGA